MPALTPYKMDVQQGNAVTQEMVSKLKPGMTRQQVRFVLGTPLVVDPFRTDRWDYVYLYETGGRVKEQRHISVIFQDDKLLRIEGDVVPARGEAAAAPEKPRPAAPPASKPVAVPAAAKPDAAAAPQPEGARLITNTGEPVTAGGAQQAKDEKAGEEKAKEQKPKEERGFFGRMLERIGF